MRTQLAITILMTAALAVAVRPVRAGEAPPAPPAPAPATTATAPTAATTGGEWQARLTAKVLEWTGQTNLDYGFSIAYSRDPNHPNSIVGPFEDGRSPLADPAAFATFPSQSHLDIGLRIFLDQISARNGAIETVVEALEQQGEVKMLAEPTLVLKKGADGPIKDADPAQAVVRTGSRLPYAAEQIAGVGVVEVTQFQETGVVLQVWFMDVVELDDLYAKMKVKASVTSLAGYVSVSVDPKGNPRQVPQTNSRFIENTVLIRNHTTLIAGILKEDSEAVNAQGPPILGDIPLIKHLFRNRSTVVRTHEILFLINVDLLAPGSV